MPTAGEFRDAARMFLAAAEDCGNASTQMRWIAQVHGVDGGSLATLVNDSFTAQANGAGACEEQCVAHADLCEQRAIICDEHAEALVAWGRAVDRWEVRYDEWANQEGARTGPRSAGPKPRRPELPELWVEVG